MLELFVILLGLHILQTLLTVVVIVFLNKKDQVILEFKKEEGQHYHDLIQIDRRLLTIDSVAVILMKEYNLAEIDTFYYNQIVEQIQKNTQYSTH